MLKRGEREKALNLESFELQNLSHPKPNFEGKRFKGLGMRRDPGEKK